MGVAAAAAASSARPPRGLSAPHASRPSRGSPETCSWREFSSETRAFRRSGSSSKLCARVERDFGARCGALGRGRRRRGRRLRPDAAREPFPESGLGPPPPPGRAVAVAVPAVSLVTPSGSGASLRLWSETYSVP